MKMDSGYGRGHYGWAWALVLLASSLAATQNSEASVCATVKIEIQQSATLERQAFDAMMKINNGLNLSLSNVTIQVNFADATGGVVTATSNPNDTNATFFCRIDTMDNITAVSNGVVAPLQTAEIHWLIIPSQGAGGTNSAGQVYAVGANLSYQMLDLAAEVDVAPATITVRPMPKLSLDYFLPGPVYGDDPLTSQIEESIPFPLGLRIRNSGAGPAGKLKIEYAQPLITENRQGLLVGFNIVGCDVQGVSAARSFLADLGTLSAGSTKVARWMMTASMMGRFTNFMAGYTHSDSLGGELTSLISAIQTHELVKDVLVDIPGRDRIRDFLASDGGSLRIYESDSAEAPVTNLSESAVLLSAGSSEGRYTFFLDTSGANQALYVKKSFPSGAHLVLLEATRADGKSLDPANAWLSKTRATGEAPWEHWLNLFDADGGGRYALTLQAQSVTNAHSPVLAYIGNWSVTLGEDLGFLVQASDADGTQPALSAEGLPPGAMFEDHGDGTGTFFWQTDAGDYGKYTVRFVASDGQLADEETIQIYAGRAEAVPALSVTDVNVREGGEGRFFVRLDGQPTGTVVVGVSRSGGDTNLWVKGGATRTFKPTNWSAWQAVTLAAGADGNAGDETATFRVTAPGCADQYVTATALDVDLGENLALASGGATIAGTKAKSPAALIDGVHAASTNYGYATWTPAPGGTMTLDLKAAMAVTRVRLLNWDWANQANRYVIESSADGSSWTTVADAGGEGRQGWDDWAVAGDPIRYLRFTGLSNSANGCVMVSEWEVYGTRVAAKADQTIDFPAVGDQYATGSVLLSATASSGLPVGFAVASGPAALDGATLTFTGAGSVTIAASQGGDGSWNAAPEAVRTFAVLEPNPALEVDGTRTNVNVREGGEGRFFVRLGGEPASNVLVTVSRAGGESIAIQSGMTRTFTPANWSTWQAVVLAAAEDENGTNETATFRISAPGTADRYLPATALDDDIGENLARAAAGGAIAGPGSSRAAQLIDGVHTVSTNYGYTIWTNDPAGTMTLDLKQATVVSRVRLLNWDWVRRVHRYVIESSADGASWTPLADASAEDRQGWDDWAVSNQTARYLRFTGLSSSANGCVLVSELEVYGARAPLPRAELSKTAVNVREGGEGRFFVRPSSAPTGSVVFTVSRVAGESIAIQSGATRSFTALNWGTWQAVTLAAAGDENTGNETATFRISAPGHADSFVAATALDDDIGENLALATGGAEIAGWKASRAAQLIDGVHAASANYGHAVWTNDPPGTMTLDLKDEMAVSRVRVLNWDWVMQANRYRIESSTNKVDWKPLADASGEDRAGWDDWEVAGDPVRYLRITALSNSANGYVCISELEVYGTRPAARKSPMASSSAVAESEPVSVLTSAGPEDESGWAAVDGDPETAWVGQQPGGGYLVVEYAPTLTLKALAVDLAEGSQTNMQYLYSLDAAAWSPLPEGLETNPVSLNFLWLVFPDDGTGAVPEVFEIRPKP